MSAVRARLTADDGAALVEFTFLAVVLMVPLVYLVVVLASVQRTAFAVTAAVRDAGRAYVMSGSDALGRRRALLAVRLTLADAAVPVQRSSVRFTCAPGPGCRFAPGSEVTVTVVERVALPGLAAVLCAGACPADVPVRATHTERLPCFVPGLPAAGQC